MQPSLETHAFTGASVSAPTVGALFTGIPKSSVRNQGGAEGGVPSAPLFSVIVAACDGSSPDRDLEHPVFRPRPLIPFTALPAPPGSWGLSGGARWAASGAWADWRKPTAPAGNPTPSGCARRPHPCSG